MMGAASGHQAPLAAYERAQERLRDAVLGACEPDAEFPVKVEAALRAAFSLLASDPTLAHLLAVAPNADAEVLRRRLEWRQRYGELLRDAAARAGALSPPFFVEPTLIGGVEFVVAGYARRGEARRLERLLPAARWYLLSCYLSPAEVAQSEVVRDP